MSLVTEQTLSADVELLQPVLSPRWALSWRHLGVCVWFAVWFVYLSYIPVFHSDIWGHVHYGHWILEHRELPSEDPVMPLAEGMQVVDNAWLAQILFALVEGGGGAIAMSVLFTATVFTASLVYARIFYRLGGSIVVMLVGVAMVFLIGYSRHAIIRPEIFGGLCFSLLLGMMTRVEPWRSRVASLAGGRTGMSVTILDERRGPSAAMPRWLWAAVPLLFVAWANLHGSFAVGLVALACHAAGRAIDVAFRERSLLAPVRDAWFRRLVVLTELALAATLVNPYGLDLLIHTARFGGNPNLRDVLEWYPLKLMDLEGILFCLSIAALVFVLRHSRTRIFGADVLLLVVFTTAMAPTVRMIGWYAPVFTLVLTPHLGELWRRWRPAGVLSQRGSTETRANPAATKPSFAPMLFCGLAVWVAFAVTPISQPFLGGKPRSKEQSHSRQTPHALTHYLREHPPQGLVFGPQWWGDWLAYQGPKQMDVFMTTNLHLAPNRVWRDYLQVSRGEAGWEETLKRYDVGTLVIHKELQAGLTRHVRRSGSWRVVYEDRLGIVAQRVKG